MTVEHNQYSLKIRDMYIIGKYLHSQVSVFKVKKCP